MEHFLLFEITPPNIKITYQINFFLFCVNLLFFVCRLHRGEIIPNRRQSTVEDVECCALQMV